jgi:hypothetical protein
VNTRFEIPHCGLEHDYSCERPRLRFADGGRLVQLSFARSPAAEWNSEMFGERGGVRGKCKGFSFSSRRRMLNHLNSVSVGAALPHFVTMTLPDQVFDDNVSRFAASAKGWLDSFTKRLRRASPGACGFWRIEWQSRKSGVHEGKLFPHFHMLLWGLAEREIAVLVRHDLGDEWITQECVHTEAYVDVHDSQMSMDFIRELAKGSTEQADAERITTVEAHGERFVLAGSHKMVKRTLSMLDSVWMAELRPESKQGQRARFMSLQDWASLAWYHVVDSHNVDHLSAGVRVERVRTWGGVMAYSAKYMAKADCGFLYEVEFGRSWGIFNRKEIPWAKIVELELDEETGVRLRRVARRYLEHRCKRRIRAPYGLTIYCDVQNFRRVWASVALNPF